MCFKGRGGYGRFDMKLGGILHSLRLVHKSGDIECSIGISKKTKWGCKFSLSVYVTRKDRKEILFPHGGEKSLYRLPGFNSNSHELIFNWPDSFYSYNVMERQKLRIWFGKDLIGENNGNHGKSCTDVYARRKGICIMGNI